MRRHVTVTISRSTNPQVQGRYFVDVRDTTHQSNPLHARQMTTRTRDHDDVVEFLGQLQRQAKQQSVGVTVKDETGEIKY